MESAVTGALGGGGCLWAGSEWGWMGGSGGGGGRGTVANVGDVVLERMTLELTDWR